jgi:heme exporter protein D
VRHCCLHEPFLGVAFGACTWLSVGVTRIVVAQITGDLVQKRKITRDHAITRRVGRRELATFQHAQEEPESWTHQDQYERTDRITSSDPSFHVGELTRGRVLATTVCEKSSSNGMEPWSMRCSLRRRLIWANAHT